MNTELRERAEAKAEEVLAKYTTEKFGNTDVDPVIFFGSLHKQIISAMIDFHKQELQRIGEVWVEIDSEEFSKQIEKDGAIHIIGGRDLNGKPRWLKKLSLLEVKDLGAEAGNSD